MDHRATLSRPLSPAAASAVPTGSPRARCRLASAGRDLRAHFAVRYAVFVTEQGFFPGTDRDEHDGEPGARHVLATSGGIPAGAVRLYPLDEPGLWRGDRLAVLPAFRSQGAGAPLVCFAENRAGEVIICGEIPVASLDAELLDRFLGLLHAGAARARQFVLPG